MPDTTEIKKFIRSLQRGKSDVADALDKIFAMNNRAALNAHPDMGTFKDLQGNPNLLHPNIPDFVRTLFTNEGVTAGEIDHINKWPKEQKENIRAALVKALDGNRAVEFFWELYGGNNEDTPIVPPGGAGTGDINITFQSPRKKLRLKSDPVNTKGDVEVPVG